MQLPFLIGGQMVVSVVIPHGMTEFARTQCQDGSRAPRVLPSTDRRSKLQAVAFSEGCGLVIQVWKGTA